MDTLGLAGIDGDPGRCVSGGIRDQALTPNQAHRLHSLQWGSGGAPTGPSGLSCDSGAFFQRSSWELKPVHPHTHTLISAHIPGTTAVGADGSSQTPFRLHCCLPSTHRVQGPGARGIGGSSALSRVQGPVSGKQICRRNPCSGVLISGQELELRRRCLG